MNQMTRQTRPSMTADEFLDWPGDGTGRKFELVDGELRPVSPTSPTHSLIRVNLTFLIMSVIRAANPSELVRIEAAVVPDSNQSLNVRVPDLVVNNVDAYASIASLREIAILHSTRIRAEIQRRDALGAWIPQPDIVGPGERLWLTSVSLDVTIEDAYRDTWLSSASR